MIEAWLTTLRNRRSEAAEFRRASDQLAQWLAAVTLGKLLYCRTSIETPLAPVIGVAPPADMALVVILRAGLALLPAFMQLAPSAPVGMLGMARDEATAQARIYYRSLPRRLPQQAIILDPMLATGGSALLAVKELRKAGLTPEAIYFAGVIAAPEGQMRLAQEIPASNITVAAVDTGLNAQKFIVPGLGDYGDRYFGAA